ncbi:MAG TPA: zinc-binding dehydrogenase [Ktedonobacterales bacterium]
MKALVYHAYDDLQIEDVPVPEIRDGELLLRVAGCGLCGSDVLKIQQRAPAPVKLGHELTGVIARISPQARDETGLREGQRVVIAHHLACGVCHYCRHDNDSLCPQFRAMNFDPCGFAEYIRVPAPLTRQMTLALPDAVSDEVGSFVEPLGCIMRALRRSRLQPGDTIVIFGLGTMGLMAAQAARAAGANVVGIDMLPDRLDFAARLGIASFAPGEAALREYVRATTAGRGADVALLTAGGAPAFTQSIELLRGGGLVHLFASAPNPQATLDIDAFYHRELSVTATYGTSPHDLRAALDLLITGNVRVDDFITHRLPLACFSEGVALFTTRQARKVYFTIHDANSK